MASIQYSPSNHQITHNTLLITHTRGLIVRRALLGRTLNVTQGIRLIRFTASIPVKFSSLRHILDQSSVVYKEKLQTIY